MASGLNLKVAQIEPKSDSKSGTVSTETGGAIRPKQVAQIEPYYPVTILCFFDGLNQLTFCELIFIVRIGSKSAVLTTYNQSEF